MSARMTASRTVAMIVSGAFVAAGVVGVGVAQASGAPVLTTVTPAPIPKPAPKPTPKPKPPTRTGITANPPGVGATWTKSLAGHNQVIVANGTNNKTNGRIRMVMWTWTKTGWHKGGSYWAWGGATGWGKTRQGDKRSPVGTYALTDAGGGYANPGTKLRYDHSTSGYRPRSSFSFVLAVGYNRIAGTPPLSNRTPLGLARGNGIWIHEGHNSFSLGCLGTSRAGVVAMLRWADPKLRPVILMGPNSQIVRTR